MRPPEARAESPDDVPWYALHVRSRQERVVAAGLGRAGLDAWLPEMGVVRRWSDRRKVVRVPCFPGYVFVRCAEGDRRRAFAVRGAVRWLGSRGGATAVDPAELDRVREALARRVPLEPWPSLAPGEEVEVVAGPLRGLRGVLVRRGEGHRLVLGVRAMGAGVAAEVDAADVDPA